MDKNFLLSLKLLEDNSVNYWLCHGTLLGIIRDGKLIEWDHDIDFAVWHNEIDKKKLKEIFLNNGFDLMSDGEGYDFITFSRGGNKRVDINLYRTDNEKKKAY